MKNLFIASLLVVATAQAGQVSAENLKLTDIILESTSSKTQCFADIISVPKNVIKYYVSYKQVGNGVKCVASLVHKESKKISGGQVVYTSYRSVQTNSYSGPVTTAYYPNEIKTAKIR